MVNKISKRLYLFLMFAFLYLPIIILIAFSFNDSKLQGVWAGFTLKWYADLFKDAEILRALYTTVIIAMLSAIISTIMGTFAAIGIHGIKGFNRNMILNLNYIPVLNPDIVTAISLMALFRLFKFEFGFITMLLSHIVFSIPYVILSVLPKLKQMDKNLAEAAMDLGATPFYALRKVIIPEILPGIITGMLLAFTLSIDDFVISFFNTGHGVSNLSITIYSMTRKGINPIVNALSTLMFVALLILLLIINKRSDEDLKLGGN
nr:ABC transporter permease [Tissierella sp.]